MKNRRRRVVTLIALLSVSIPAGAHASSTGIVPPAPRPIPGAPGIGSTPGSVRSADAFANSIAVNVHLGMADTSYGNTQAVVSALMALGVRHIRDGMTTSTAEWTTLKQLAALGIDTDMIAPPPFTTPDIASQVQWIKSNPGAVVSVEGPNEFDHAGDPTWPGDLRAYQTQLFQLVTSDPTLAHMSVLGPSFGNGKAYAIQGDLTGVTNLGNFHPYPGAQMPEKGIAAQRVLLSAVSGHQPQWATETGYGTNMANAKGTPVSERAQGIYIPRLLATNFEQGVSRTFLYELADEGAGGYGLVRSDFSRKPAYQAVANLMALTSDPGIPFTARPLSYVLNTPPGVEHLLLGRRDGSFDLLVWQSASVWSLTTHQDLSPTDVPATLTLSGGHPNMTTYRPGVSTTPVSTSTGQTSVSLNIPADILVIHINPGGGG
jgi:hypothetical protein